MRVKGWNGLEQAMQRRWGVLYMHESEVNKGSRSKVARARVQADGSVMTDTLVSLGR